LLGTGAILIYGTLYYTLMPTVHVEKPLHFQYEFPSSSPTANVQFTPKLVSENQEYDIFARFELPESEVNREFGVFMVQLELFHQGKGVFTSSRPTMLRYKSGLLETMSTVAYAIPLLLGLYEQKQIVDVRLVENLLQRFTSANITLSKPIQLYSASFTMQAKLSGLRYVCYNWFWTCSVIGSAWMLVVELFCLSFAWIFIKFQTKPAQDYTQFKEFTPSRPPLPHSPESVGDELLSSGLPLVQSLAPKKSANVTKLEDSDTEEPLETAGATKSPTKNDEKTNITSSRPLIHGEEDVEEVLLPTQTEKDDGPTKSTTTRKRRT